MLPLSLLRAAKGSSILIEVRNGETFNGELVNVDNWMNVSLTNVLITSSDGQRFWQLKECFIRGNNVKYLQVPEDVLDKVKAEMAQFAANQRESKQQSESGRGGRGGHGGPRGGRGGYQGGNRDDTQGGYRGGRGGNRGGPRGGGRGGSRGGRGGSSHNQ